MSELKILTLSWQGKDKLQELYPSLKASLNDINFKWFIKDNGSTDGSIDLINSWEDPNVIGIKYPNNTDTFAYGCNFLFKEASCNDDDFVLLLNNDVKFIDTNSIRKMMNLFKNPDIGLVGAKTLFKDSNLIQHAGVVFHMRYGMPFHFGANQKDCDIFSKNREFQAVTGAVWLTKAEYFRNICTTNKSGQFGLTEDYIWAFEDISACLAIKYNMNKKVICCGETKILHDESSSLKKNPMNKLFHNKNTNTFLNLWKGRYILDADDYNKSPKYNLYK